MQRCRRRLSLHFASLVLWLSNVPAVVKSTVFCPTIGSDVEITTQSISRAGVTVTASAGVGQFSGPAVFLHRALRGLRIAFLRECLCLMDGLLLDSRYGKHVHQSADATFSSELKKGQRRRRRFLLHELPSNAAEPDRTDGDTNLAQAAPPAALNVYCTECLNHFQIG